jgi:hypothetical protein
MSPEQIMEVVEQCRQTGYLPDGTRQCLLCNSSCPDEPMFVGLWIPGKQLQRRLGCAEQRRRNGGARTVLYLVCPTCYHRPSMEDEVENIILRRVSVQ